MSIFQQTLEQSDERFLRDVGISKATFQQLLDKVATYLAVQREKNPMKKRGLKSTTSIADQLLLTLTYLRHYPTFAKLGKEFSISESYANKIYHRMLDMSDLLIWSKMICLIASYRQDSTMFSDTQREVR